MRIVKTTPRQDWQSRVESEGFTFYLKDGYGTNWLDDTYLEISELEYIQFQDATTELNHLFKNTIEYLLGNKDELAKFNIPRKYWDWIHESYTASLQRGIYGRFDLMHGPDGLPKLLEFNADTPTTLVESAIIQWTWLQDRMSEFSGSVDQFNSIHDDLIKQWGLQNISKNQSVHFAFSSESLEEKATCAYMMDVAAHAGINVISIDMKDIGSDGTQLYDLNEQPIENLFKLYPWEWMINEPFGDALLWTKTKFFEPPWKMLCSCKAILPVMWELHRNHPYLLESSWEKINDSFAKPIFGREGKGITHNNTTIDNPDYDVGPVIYQKSALSNKPPIVVGSWLIGSASSGLIARTSDTSIVTDESPVIPHVVI